MTDKNRARAYELREILDGMERDEAPTQTELHAAYELRQAYERLLTAAVENSQQAEEQAARSVA